MLERCRERAEPRYLTWGIPYEFLRVTAHPAIFRRPLATKDAWVFLEAVLASPGLGMLLKTKRRAHVAAEVFVETPQLTGNVAFDAHTAVLMGENGIRAIYAHDSDFNRLAFIDALDPATGRRRTSSRRRG